LQGGKVCHAFVEKKRQGYGKNFDLLTLTDIIKRLERKEIATKNVNGAASTNLVFDEIVEATLEGYHVVTPLFRAGVGFHGVVHTQDLEHHIPADRVHLQIRFAQGAAVRDA
jgi:hypothetical protein